MHAVIFGIVEGLTEFLPVSSTGHLILTAKLLGLPQTEFMKSFEIAIQVGAILGVSLLYWRSFLKDFETLKRVFAAFLPTAVIGFLLYKIIKHTLLAGTSVVLWSLFLGGIALILFDRFHPKTDNTIQQTKQIPLSKAAAIGLAQSISVIPGVSRSGATILGGLMLGIDRKTTVEFSFLLAAPTLLAATVLDLFRSAPSFESSQWPLLFTGIVVSFIVAIFSMKFFIGFVQKHGFIAFGIYRIALAIVFWTFVR